MLRSADDDDSYSDAPGQTVVHCCTVASWEASGPSTIIDKPGGAAAKSTASTAGQTATAATAAATCTTRSCPYPCYAWEVY